MKKITTTFASLILLASPSLFAGEVYRVIDEHGQVTFTDSPAASTKAESVDLPKTNIVTAPPPPAKKENNSGDDGSEEEVAYTSARILQPSNNATIPPGQLEVAVQLALKPSLQSGHLVQLYVDGRKQGSPSATSTFSVTGLNRGKHSVHAEVLGSDKKRKTKTQTVTFHVKQHSSNKQKKAPQALSQILTPSFTAPK